MEQVAIEGDRIQLVGVESYLRTGKFLVLEQGEEMLGCVYVEKRGDRGYLGLLAVNPSLQKQGVGRRLGDAAEKYFREGGCCAVDLRVISARDELLGFYQKLGYVITGISPMPETIPLKIPCHYIHMSKSLV